MLAVETPAVLEVAVADHGTQGKRRRRHRPGPSCSADIEPVTDQVAPDSRTTIKYPGQLLPSYELHPFEVLTENVAVGCGAPNESQQPRHG